MKEEKKKSSTGLLKSKKKIIISIVIVLAIIIGSIVAYIVSILAIKFLLDYIKKHDFKVFGYYRIVLGILVLAYFFLIK